MLALTVQYFLLVYLAGIGVVQVAGAYAGLRGLLLLVSPRMSVVFGVLLIAAAFVWFFGILDRNVRGLEGTEQGLLFIPASIAAVVSAAMLSSFFARIREPRPRLSSAPLHGERARGGFRRARRSPGLEALRSATYLDVLLREDEGPVR